MNWFFMDLLISLKSDDHCTLVYMVFICSIFLAPHPLYIGSIICYCYIQCFCNCNRIILWVMIFCRPWLLRRTMMVMELLPRRSSQRCCRERRIRTDFKNEACFSNFIYLISPLSDWYLIVFKLSMLHVKYQVSYKRTKKP